jgi:hypothetical protein
MHFRKRPSSKQRPVTHNVVDPFSKGNWVVAVQEAVPLLHVLVPMVQVEVVPNIEVALTKQITDMVLKDIYLPPDLMESANIPIYSELVNTGYFGSY